MATTLTKSWPSGMLQSSVELDEITHTSIKYGPDGVYAYEFDEVSSPTISPTDSTPVAERKFPDGTYQVYDYFDEVTLMPAAAVTSGLVMLLDAGDTASYPGSGTTWTDTIGSKEFTLFNGPTYNSANGGYINFVAASSQYGYATSFGSALTQYTVEVWHKFDGTLTGAAPVLFGEGRGTYSNFMMGTTAGRTAPLKIQGGFWNGAWQQGTTDPGDYFQPANGWYQFVNTYDGAQIKFYANNTLRITKTPSNFTIASSGLGLNIMRRQDAFNYWGGGMSIIRVYNRALSAVEIEQNWTANRSRFSI